MLRWYVEISRSAIDGKEIPTYHLSIKVALIGLQPAAKVAHLFKALNLYPSNREVQGSIPTPPTFSNNIFGNNITLNVPKPH